MDNHHWGLARGDDVDVDYDGDDWDMEEKDGDEEESWLEMEQIYWIENEV